MQSEQSVCIQVISVIELAAYLSENGWLECLKVLQRLRVWSRSVRCEILAGTVLGRDQGLEGREGMRESAFYHHNNCFVLFFVALQTMKFIFCGMINFYISLILKASTSHPLANLYPTRSPTHHPGTLSSQLDLSHSPVHLFSSGVVYRRVGKAGRK